MKITFNSDDNLALNKPLIAIKDSEYVKIHSVNTLYLIIGEVDVSIEEKHGNKYLVFASTDKNKEVLEKYTEPWDEIKKLIEKIDNKPGEYGTFFMKIKFNSDDNLALNKPLIAIKDSEYVKIHSVNTLYLIIGEVDVSIEEKNWK